MENVELLDCLEDRSVDELYQEGLGRILTSKAISKNELFQALLHGDDFHELPLYDIFVPPIRVAQVEIDEVTDV